MIANHPTFEFLSF